MCRTPAEEKENNQASLISIFRKVAISLTSCPSNPKIDLKEGKKDPLIQVKGEMSQDNPQGWQRKLTMRKKARMKRIGCSAAGYSIKELHLFIVGKIKLHFCFLMLPKGKLRYSARQ